jgi:hypothetical protein
MNGYMKRDLRFSQTININKCPIPVLFVALHACGSLTLDMHMSVQEKAQSGQVLVLSQSVAITILLVPS